MQMFERPECPARWYVRFPVAVGIAQVNNVPNANCVRGVASKQSGIATMIRSQEKVYTYGEEEETNLFYEENPRKDKQKAENERQTEQKQQSKMEQKKPCTK